MYQLLLLPLLLLPLASAKQNDCTLARDPGDVCDQPSTQRFFFDVRTKHCQPFFYKGCYGNGNNFKTRDECAKMCSDAEKSTSLEAVCDSGAYAAGATSFVKPLDCNECPKGYECEHGLCCPTKDYLCNLQYDAGKSGDEGLGIQRFFYSKSLNNCIVFTYHGRDGNANNFKTYNECKEMCMSE